MCEETHRVLGTYYAYVNRNPTFNNIENLPCESALEAILLYTNNTSQAVHKPALYTPDAHRDIKQTLAVQHDNVFLGLSILLSDVMVDA